MPKLTSRARKDLDALPERLATTAREVIRRLDSNPTMGKKLKGNLAGRRSAQLGRSHRIIYTTTSGEVIVLTVVSRRDAYR